MVNKAIIVGNVGQDPEVRSLPNGTSVGEFSVATNRKYRDRHGETQEDTEWHTVVVWAKTAENAKKILRSGDTVYVEGRLQTDSWEDRETGKTMYRTKINAYTFQIVKWGKNHEDDFRGGRNRFDEEDQWEEGASQDDDDIPF